MKELNSIGYHLDNTSGAFSLVYDIPDEVSHAIALATLAFAVGKQNMRWRPGTNARRKIQPRTKLGRDFAFIAHSQLAA